MSNDLLGNTKKYEVSPIVALRGQKRMGYTPPYQSTLTKEQEACMPEPVQLTTFGVTEIEAQQALDRVKVRDVDYADLYFESRTSESVSMEEGIVKRAAKSVSQGWGFEPPQEKRRVLPIRMS